MKKEPQVEYLPDSSVDAFLDAELRRLLTTCFTKPQDVVFKDRRYFCEPYLHRWVVRDAQDSTAGAGWDSLGVLRHPDKVNGVDRWVETRPILLTN